MRYIENNEGMGGGRISLLDRAEMYGANGLMCGLVRALYFTQIVGDAGVHY